MADCLEYTIENTILAHVKQMTLWVEILNLSKTMIKKNNLRFSLVYGHKDLIKV